MRRTRFVILATLLIGAALSHEGFRSPSFAQQATPETLGPAAISSEVLGRAKPAVVENPELTLGRVTVMPGAVLPVHYHLGTQIGFVAQGELTYTVHTGTVELHRADAAGEEPYVIGLGETVTARPGDVLVESPEEIHQARNDGNVPIIIYLSSLFPAGAPRAVVVEGTPVP